MKEFFKRMFLTVAVVALPVVEAPAAPAYNGDLIIGFTAGSGNDLEYDLGNAAALTDGETFPALTALLGSYTPSTLHWGIIGNTLNGVGGAADNQVYTTTSGSTILPGSVNQTIYNGVFNATKGVYGLFPAAGAGQHTSPSIGLANSWYAQTVSPTLTTQYKNAYESPNVFGTGSAVLWSVDTQGGPTVELGNFTLDGSGGVTFTSAVPEPTTCTLITLAGLVGLCFRRQGRNA
jgi:hypothetical protein